MSNRPWLGAYPEGVPQDIDPSQYQALVQVMIPTGIPAGTYWLYLHTDGANAVAETNENDNIGGFVQIPILQGGQRLDAFLEPVFADLARVGTGAAHGAAAAAGHGAEAAHAVHDPTLEIVLMVISLGIALVGIFVAHRFYVKDPQAPHRLAEKARRWYDLLWHKYWVDEIYDARIVQPIVRLSNRLWKDVDAAVVDGAVNGVAKRVEQGAGWLRLAQTGYVQLYALILVMGMVVVFGYLALR